MACADLHVGFDASGLEGLEMHHIVVNDWTHGVDSEQVGLLPFALVLASRPDSAGALTWLLARRTWCSYPLPPWQTPRWHLLASTPCMPMSQVRGQTLAGLRIVAFMVGSAASADACVWPVQPQSPTIAGKASLVEAGLVLATQGACHC